MKEKIGLNNTQRKMLDEIYTEQFEQKIKPIIAARKAGYDKLVQKVEQKELKKKEVSSLIQNSKKLFEQYKKLEPYFRENGLSVNNIPCRDISIKLSKSYYNSYSEHPELAQYEKETFRIQDDLAKKKKEIRARVYGMDTTYENVDKEISEYLKSII